MQTGSYGNTFFCGTGLCCTIFYSRKFLPDLFFGYPTVIVMTGKVPEIGMTTDAGDIRMQGTCEYITQVLRQVKGGCYCRKYIRSFFFQPVYLHAGVETAKHG